MADSRPTTFTEFLYEHMDSVPADRPAIIDHDSGCRLSFGELKRQVGAVASALAKRGFGRGHFLSMFVTNCQENAPIAHGTMATGGTLHLVKPNASHDELLFHMRLVQPRFLVTTADRATVANSVVEEVDSGVEEVFVIGAAPANCRSAQELLEDAGDANPMGRVEIDPENDVAVLLQTGGTTGFSKTVMATHMALKYFADCDVSFGKCPCDVVATFTPFSYVTSLTMCYGTWLANGSTIVSLSKFDPEVFLTVIDKYQVCSAFLSPATAAALAKSPHFDRSRLTSLKVIPWGGAPIPKELEDLVIKRFEEKNSDVQFHHLYGMTEVQSAISEALPDLRRRPNKEGTAGIPLPHSKVKVVSCRDDTLDCKPGEPGQIVVRCSTMMKGYFKNEALTAKVLRNGWYYTGDYGWLDEDNCLFVVDRIEDLIINDKAVIVPSQLEAHIQSHPKVKECVVVGKKMEGGEWPMACVVVNEPVSAEEIQEFVANRVEPHHQLKGGVLFIKEVPKSLAGKLLRKSFAQS